MMWGGSLGSAWGRKARGLVCRAALGPGRADPQGTARPAGCSRCDDSRAVMRQADHSAFWSQEKRWRPREAWVTPLPAQHGEEFLPTVGPVLFLRARAPPPPGRAARPPWSRPPQLLPTL